MGFKIQQANSENAEEIAKLLLAVSASAHLMLEFGSCKREEWLLWYIENVRCEVESCAKLGAGEAEALVVCDNEEGRIAGFAVWSWSGRGASQTISDEKKGIQLPQGTNLPLRQHFTTALHALEEGHRPQERHYELLNLATSPHYQRKGIASRLLGYGLEKADKEGVKVFLTASPMGKLLYRKLGFEELGSLSIDLREFGGEGEYCHRAMVRMPRKVAKGEQLGDG